MGGEKNYAFNYAVFCQVEGLNPNWASSQRAFERDLKGLPWKRSQMPEIVGDGPLSWEQIDELIGGCSGTINVPCPYCGPDKPYSTRLRITRTILCAEYRCFYCGARGRVENPDPVPDELIEQDARVVREQDESDRRVKYETAMGIWQSAVALSPDTFGFQYLKARGLLLPRDAYEVLRWHEHCPWKRGDEPCIVALFRDAMTDQPTGIHRIRPYSLLKAEKMSLGSWPKHNAGVVKLWKLGTNETLAVGEGLENVLSAIQLGLAEPPAWATTVALKLARLPVIKGIKHLLIIADNDESGTGIEKATKLYHTYKRADRNAEIVHPKTDGTDFNDLLLRRRAQS